MMNKSQIEHIVLQAHQASKSKPGLAYFRSLEDQIIHSIQEEGKQLKSSHMNTLGKRIRQVHDQFKSTYNGKAKQFLQHVVKVVEKYLLEIKDDQPRPQRGFKNHRKNL